MRYRIDITEAAKINFKKLDINSQKTVIKCFEWIEEYDSDFVAINRIDEDLNEIKINGVRIIFEYYKKNKILIALILKNKNTRQRTSAKLKQEARMILIKEKYSVKF